LIYSASTAVMLVSGSVVLAFVLAPAALVPSLLAGLVGGVALAVAVAVAWHRPRILLKGAVRWLQSKVEGRPRVRAVAGAFRRTAETLRVLVLGDPARLSVVILLHLIFQAAAIGEVWLALIFLGGPRHTLFDAFLLEYANRAVTVAFKFVPMRLGVDELASGVTASILGASASLGVTIALVRKARVACWSILGALLLATRIVITRVRPGTDRPLPGHAGGATW
jgi:hypothetical protein